ncbi:MAG: LysR family transcriptional regulator [Verrucomicrobia bacterium]|nr:MAG: LysR family transcriptional regulator [Verrucomicrobiota bacterium]
MPSILNDTVELRHLRYLRAVADAGSFTRAAAEIGLTQPTLSQQIAQLEQGLGVELLTRSRRECRLTPAGEMVMQYAGRILGDVDALKRSLDDMSELRRGTLRIGALPTLAQCLLPRVLTRFHQAHPDIRVTVLEMSVDDMARAIANGMIELGIGCLGTSLGLKGELLFSEELVAVLAKDDALSNRTVVTVAELAKRPIIVPPPGYGTRTLINHAWAKSRRRAIFSLEVSSVESALQAVSGSGSPAILPSSALWGLHPAGWIVRRITRPVMRRQIGFLVTQGGHPRPAIQALIPIVRKVTRELADPALSQVSC